MKTLSILSIAMLSLSIQANAFIVSTATKIQPNKIYEYYITDTAIAPDISVKVSETAIAPDFTFKIVHDPKEADLIFVDDYEKADVFVTKAKSALAAKTIKVSATSIAPDITVKLADNPIAPDYKIYVLSTRFTKEEAAALFAIYLKAAKDKK
jgi:hypothetical protein